MVIGNPETLRLRAFKFTKKINLNARLNPLTYSQLEFTNFCCIQSSWAI